MYSHVAFRIMKALSLSLSSTEATKTWQLQIEGLVIKYGLPGTNSPFKASYKSVNQE